VPYLICENHNIEKAEQDHPPGSAKSKLVAHLFTRRQWQLRRLTCQDFFLGDPRKGEGKKMENDRILTAEQAAQYLSRKISAIYQLVHRKEIPHYKPSGKCLYFLESELRDWILARRISTNEELDASTSTEIISKRAE